MRTVVGVLRGGPSSEYEVSLKSGASVLEALPKDKYDARDIFIDRTGVWHNRGIAADPHKALAGVDVAFNVIHGQYGEDGQVQRILDQLAVPYVGSGALASATAFNKDHTRTAAKRLGLQIAHGRVVERQDPEQLAHELFRSFPMPAIIKPVSGGSSIATSLATNFYSLVDGLHQAFAHSSHVLVEEFIRGKEATVGVIDDFRGERAYALMPTEIRFPSGVEWYDAQTKQTSAAEFITPSTFAPDVKLALQDMAKQVHTGLGLRHYSRSDFIVSKRGIFFLEVETSVDMGPDTEMLHGLEAGGATLSHFVDHVVQLAHKRT